MNKALPILLIVILLISCEHKSGDLYYEEAKQAYADSEMDKAKDLFRTAIDKGLSRYNVAEAYTFIGNIYSDRDQFDSSILMYTTATILDSTYVDAWVNMGIDYRLSAEYDKAKECYNQAMKIDPNDPELYASLGALYIFQGESEKAVSTLKKAVELDPNLAVSHSNYALALAMAGNFTEAEAELKAAIALGYKNGETIKERIEELRKIEE